MIELTFSKSGWDDIVLTEDDLFDFRFERGCFSGDTFELGGVSAKSIYMIIDNNTQRFPRGAFANSRVRLDIDGHFCGYFNAELPKRRNGVIELTAYDDMIKLDTEFPEEVQFPQTFISVYGHCVLAAGLADHFSIISGDTFVLNALFNNGVISHEYTDYIYANSCRNVVSGMAEWNGGFAYINDDGKLQVDVFSKEVSRTFYSGELMDFDYSDETVVFSKIKTSQKNKTYEMGDDSGYTLIINNQYIGYGLDDEDFEMYLGFIYDYYKDFSLTPMSFTLAEPDFSLKTGDRISVVDEEENVTVTGNISEISVSGNCSMTVTCGGFGNVSGVVNYNKSSTGLNNQTKAGAGSGGVGKAAESDPTSEYFNDYENNKIVTYAAGYHHVEGKDNKCGPGLALHVGGVGNVVRYGTALRAEGSGNTLDSGTNSSVGGNGNIVKNVTATRVDGTGNTVEHTENSYIIGKENKIEGMNGILAGEGNEVSTGNFRAIFGKHIKGSSSVRPRMIIGEYNEPISGVVYTTSLAFEIGCGNSSNRRSCFAVDYEGNVYCNKVIETGTDNILGGAADETAISAQTARTLSSAVSAGIPIVLLNHTPTADDLTGSPCVFLQCDNTASVEGETTGIFRVTDIFAEKSLQ